MLISADKAPSIYANKVRVRVCGLLIEEEKLLLIKHKSIGEKNILWSPPGGGTEFGENAKDALKREFLEETNLEIEVGQFLFTYEMINETHHAIELFFHVKRTSGTVRLGADPELKADNQIISEISYLSSDEIDKMDKRMLHGIFREVDSAKKVLELRGLFSFKH